MVIEEPACSKPAQKKMTKNVRITITAMRCFSILERPAEVVVSTFLVVVGSVLAGAVPI